MPKLQTLFNPSAYLCFIKNQFRLQRDRKNPNLRGVLFYTPGHFYSPLLDIGSFLRNGKVIDNDGIENWEYINLNHGKQIEYYKKILQKDCRLLFPVEKMPGTRYYTNNIWFVYSDALTLYGVIHTERPHRIVEIGSGFSSAVMLDSVQQFELRTSLTFIEPHPERLNELISSDERDRCCVFQQPVQSVPITIYDDLSEGDILFIDSSHVAKVGSDLTFLLLRVLPRLKSGVIVHFHDIFFPFSYPEKWIFEGRAWNESLFLRAFLLNNREFEVFAFNSYAAFMFPELFKEHAPKFLQDSGGSFWMRKL
jgi:hypothetical protein